MQLIASNRITIAKCLLIALIVLSLALSSLDCIQELERQYEEDTSESVWVVTRTSNNFSVFALVVSGLQILLILLNRYRLQVLPGILAAVKIVVMPSIVDMTNHLGSIVYMGIVAGPSGPVRPGCHLEVTPLGRAYVIVGWLQLAMTVFSAWWMRKQKAIIDAEYAVAQEEIEVVE